MPVETVTCNRCQREHDKAGETYFRVLGNIYIGQEGGLVGNAFDELGFVKGDSNYCTVCLLTYLYESALQATLNPAP